MKSGDAYVLVQRIGQLTVVVEDEETPLPAFRLVQLEVGRRYEQVAVFAYLSVRLLKQKQFLVKICKKLWNPLLFFIAVIFSSVILQVKTFR